MIQSINSRYEGSEAECIGDGVRSAFLGRARRLEADDGSMARKLVLGPTLSFLAQPIIDYAPGDERPRGRVRRNSLPPRHISSLWAS